MTEIEQPSQNGIDLSAAEDDDSSKARPADIEQDMREMERRKRVEAIMSSKLFREELERIVDSARDGGGASGILQQLSDIVGVPSARVGSTYKASNCLLPINDIRGVESMGYAKGEKILRCKLAATFRLLDLYGWTQGLGAQITARLKVDQEYFLVNPYGLLYHEITASSLNKVDMQGHIVEQGTTNFGVNKNHFVLHSIAHAARPDIRCAIYIGCSPVVAVSSLKCGLLPLTKDACVLGEITSHLYTGSLLEDEERNKLVRNLGPNSKLMLLANHGALCFGETIEEAFFAACHIVQACETQLKLLPVGLDNLVLIPEESRKIIYDQSRRPPEDLEKKFAAAVSTEEDGDVVKENTVTKVVGSIPKWRVGGAEFEALMRMLDNAGYRTGYIYRHPLIKSDPPKPKNDVELPPAVSSLGYLLEEEELFRQGIWKKGDLRKGGDRSRWLNSPNVYQKVEVLETGTPDPKKITKWVAEGSPTHSTPVRIEDPLQFVPAGTNPKEFKRLQQQIKDNRRADKISAGPQSHILEGVTWDEANRIKDATVSSTGDHVVLMGAASKGIIQRGYQHNATVYKAPYAKNPFDNVTDDELNEYKRTVERKKKSIHGEYTDTDFSESEALSSLPTSGAQQTKTAGVSQSEPEDMSEHQIMRIETQQAPVPSQPEVVLSDAHLHIFHSLFVSHSKLQKNILNYQERKQIQFDNNALNDAINHAILNRKYAFLFENATIQPANNICLFIIHKIETLSHYTYPLANVNNDDSQSQHITSQSAGHSDNLPTIAESLASVASLPPYRTVSHYGFNYPLTYLRTIQLHPENAMSSVELQRQKIIAFIKSTGISFAHSLHKRDANVARQQNMHDNNNNGSFISMKEIQLEPKKRRRNSKHSSTPIKHGEPEHDVDALSEQCSLLSVTGTYAAASNSHSGDLAHEHENANDDHFDDSGDNCSNFTAPPSRHTESDNLYRSYVLRNFLPISHSSNHSNSYEHDIEHKPESEQALVGEFKSSRTDGGDKGHDYQHGKGISPSSSFRKRNCNRRRNHHEATDNLTDSAASLKSIEIHINISIKNSDCVKSLQTHEQEFKSKLEKIIDDEINMISQQLIQQNKRKFSSDPMLVQHHATGCHDDNNTTTTITRRCDSAMEPLNVNPNGAAGDTARDNRDIYDNHSYGVESNAKSDKTPSLSVLHSHHILSLLEHELENLLNSIIRANELHNHAIMCDCKTKISQITDDIRSSLSIVKSDN